MKIEAFLKQMKKELETLSNLKKDPGLSNREKYEIEYSFITISEFLTTYIETSKDLLETESRREMLSDEKYYAEEHSYILSLLAPFIEKEEIPMQKIKPITLNLPEIKDTLLEIMDFICDDTLFKKFESLYQFKRTQINFIKSENKNSNNNVSFFIPTFNEAYVFVNKVCTPDVLIFLSHEIGHAISFFTNFNYPNFGLEIFYEIPSEIFEMLSLHILSKKPEYQEYIRNLKIEHWNDFLTSSKICILESTFLESLDYEDLENISQRDLRLSANATIKNSTCKLNYQDLLKPTITTELKYIIGYLIGIEIVMLYDKDRDQGIGALKSLLEIDNKTSALKYLSEIQKIITIGEHLDEYQKKELGVSKEEEAIRHGSISKKM